MGYMMRGAFDKADECQAAWLQEREFVEAARALKTLAADIGEDVAPAVEALVRHGVEAAFAVLRDSASHQVSEAHLRTRVH